MILMPTEGVSILTALLLVEAAAVSVKASSGSVVLSSTMKSVTHCSMSPKLKVTLEGAGERSKSRVGVAGSGPGVRELCYFIVRGGSERS